MLAHIKTVIPPSVFVWTPDSVGKYYCSSCWLLKIEACTKQWTMTVAWPVNGYNSRSVLAYACVCLYERGRLHACTVNVSVCMRSIQSAVTRIKENIWSLKWHNSSRVSAYIPFTEGHNLKWTVASATCVVNRKMLSYPHFPIWHFRHWPNAPLQIHLQSVQQ